MVDESTFIERAVLYLADVSGEDPSSIDGDTQLLDTGFIDSLALISFLAFLEEQRGSPLPISPADGLPLDALASIRTAYRQLLATG